LNITRPRCETDFVPTQRKDPQEWPGPALSATAPHGQPSVGQLTPVRDLLTDNHSASSGEAPSRPVSSGQASPGDTVPGDLFPRRGSPGPDPAALFRLMRRAATPMISRASEIEVTDSTQGARHRLDDLMADCDELHSMVPSARLGENIIEASWLQAVHAPRDGTRVRTLYADDVVDHLPSMDFIRESLEAGAEARSMAVVPTWLTIIGREVVVIARDPGGAQSGVLLVRGGGYVNTALWFFGHAWAAASPLPLAAGPISLSPWERRVLVHLARGVKDESGARELGVSSRTYRRHVTELCEHLGASSRVDGGGRATHAGRL
jgi:hypothetical protein